MAFLFGMVDRATRFTRLDMLLTEVNHEGQSGSPA
jgi:hypothetical protein